jgi:NAD(P)H-flavin reductase
MMLRGSLQKVRWYSKLPEINEAKPKGVVPPMANIQYKPQVSTPFSPKDSYPRQSFEFPHDSGIQGPPRWKNYLPGFIALGGVIWGGFAYQYVMDDTPLEYLSQNRFTPFVITNKLMVDDDHYLIELTPKYSKWKKFTTMDQIWNGNKLWSVEIKQPQIMVVRRYTPLPLELYDSEFTDDPVVRIQDENSSEGKLVLYIKKYSQGEVARWIDRKPIGSELELRGPYEEFKFPITKNNNVKRPQVKNVPSETPPDPQWSIKPHNMAFFAGGTGIAPVLQLLLTQNPYRGFINVYYSHKTQSEVPMKNILTILEKLDRAKFHHGTVYKKTVLEQGELSDEPYNEDKKYMNSLEQAQEKQGQEKNPPTLALVCGPDGFVSYIAGPKPYEGQGPLGGLLKQKKWDAEHVFKM